jgi:urease accessory protein
MKNLKITLATIATVTLAATPVLAHHPMGGRVPATLFEGLMSGVAHPVIGIDHIVMVVAIGLFAGIKRHGFWLPIAFGLAAMAGTAVHLAAFTLPGAELWVAGSVLVLGLLMLIQERLGLAAIAGLIGFAGLFHGYAYGEAIIGAEATPLVAYLAGFTAVQLAIALGVSQLAKVTMVGNLGRFRAAALTTIGIGTALVVVQSIA